MIAEVATREQLADFAPLAERASSIDDATMIRFRGSGSTISGFVRLPHEVLAGRTVSAVAAGQFDVTVSVSEFLRWLDADGAVPARKDAHWLSPLPPRSGWQRIEVVPDAAIREIIRSGVSRAQDANTAANQQSLLSAIVLTAQAGEIRVPVPLGPVSALTRMGFLPRDCEAAVDILPGWIRLAAPYGSTFVTTGVSPLGMLNLGS